MAQISFHGPRLKLRRANKHIEELEKWLADILQSNSETARSYKERNRGTENDTVLVQRPDGYADCIAPIVGDVAHNLRAALDLAASAIVIAAGQNPEQPLMYFPLCDTRRALLKNEHYQRIWSIAPDLALVILDTVKPYKSANYSLWALNRLDRMDRHRMLVPTLAESINGTIVIREEDEDAPPPAGPGTIYMIGGRRRADGTVISAAREPRRGSVAQLHNQSNGYSTLNLWFSKGGVFEDEPILSKLRQLAQLVADTIDALKKKRNE
jgi:hypothetical protein